MNKPIAFAFLILMNLTLSARLSFAAEGVEMEIVNDGEANAFDVNDVFDKNSGIRKGKDDQGKDCHVELKSVTSQEYSIEIVFSKDKTGFGMNSFLKSSEFKRPFLSYVLVAKQSHGGGLNNWIGNGHPATTDTVTISYNENQRITKLTYENSTSPQSKRSCFFSNN